MSFLKLRMITMLLAGCSLVACETSRSTKISDNSLVDDRDSAGLKDTDSTGVSTVPPGTDDTPTTTSKTAPTTNPDTVGDTGSDTMDECAAVTDHAELIPMPVDIVIAVDNSGSMRDEAQWVQDNMNGFSSQIAASGVDYHIALISASNDVAEGICVDVPLGNGDCPNDSNPPKFLHVFETVSSVNALSVINDTYDQWKSILRPNSMRHFLVVSDDDSTNDADTFAAWMSDRGISKFTFHAIVASEGSEITWSCLTGGSHACCAEKFPHSPLGSQRGKVYIELADETGGLWGDLCEQDFGPVFDELATTIGEVSIACHWDIPDPPEGETFDPSKVNIEFDDGAGNEHAVGYVQDPSLCDSVEHGWYYDDPSNPTRILVCGQTCDWLRGFENGAVEIILGCETNTAVVV